MSILKTGSKGKDVQIVQDLLNKAKAKPKLKIDGIFGKLTDNQTRIFQKNLKLKVDGKVGSNTLAALKHGGPLPTMNVIDYKTMKTSFSGDSFGLSKDKDLLISLEKKTAILASTAAKQLQNAMKIHKNYLSNWAQASKMIDQVVSLQAQFEKEVTKNPAKAEKLAKECEKLDKQVVFIIDKKIAPEIGNLGACGAYVLDELNGCSKEFKELRSKFSF